MTHAANTALMQTPQPGYYSPAVGASSCLPCQIGRYSPQAADSCSRESPSEKMLPPYPTTNYSVCSPLRPRQSLAHCISVSGLQLVDQRDLSLKRCWFRELRRQCCCLPPLHAPRTRAVCPSGTYNSLAAVGACASCPAGARCPTGASGESRVAINASPWGEGAGSGWRRCSPPPVRAQGLLRPSSFFSRPGIMILSPLNSPPAVPLPGYLFVSARQQQLSRICRGS